FNLGYSVTDTDGDFVNGTLTVNVDDDTPIARNDTDSVSANANTATGNVVTGVGTTSGAAGADSYGADGSGGVVGVASNNVPAHTDTTADGSGNFQVDGQFGSLNLNEDGSYTYTKHAGLASGGTEVFTYTIADGDGDTTTATLTITVGAEAPPP